ncbi:thiamine ABC transporter substrate binding subunit [Xinfangfangia sp. D13-10-4-6]|uniref:thiamine ABC transporter substrate binding subunit n=1 Tax=Pseudogemmobacter hezensis TaxID=2737662 RepID=UPI001552E64F|nr:thiamine ABC transporter substrate binding subunit [Pseudogemmobacter hezensis]NPD14279.1 thiamine ABC transporter substrate binding subunit [Pseudogemmobacter hezensis]
MRPFLAACFLTLPSLALPGLAVAETPVLTVMTYDSFTSEWGPGPAIEKAFEEHCGCDLRFITGGDGAALLARLQLEGASSEADIVLGLDTNLTAQAQASGLFAPHGADPATALPIPYQDPLFLPYDWGWFAFVYDKTRTAMPPEDFRALGDSDLKIVIQDPRSSTPGLGLLMWVKAAYGDQAPDIWAGLSDNILTVTPGWSEAYGLFLEGEADMVLSYSTSPAYHRLAEQDDSKDWVEFAEGHYLQIEVAGLLASSKQPELAREFLTFTQSPAFQSVIPETNWMYPAASQTLPEGFETHRPAKSLLLGADEALEARATALTEWQAALGR